MNENPNRSKQLFNGPLKVIGLASAAALLSVGLYAGVQFYYQSKAASPVAEVATPNAPLDNPISAAEEGEKGLLRKTAQSFRDVAKKIGPAVVNIKSTKSAPKAPTRSKGLHRRGRPQGPGMDRNDEGGGMRDPLYEFFERFGMPFPMPQQESPQVSMGSGILIDSKGHIVTNNHVIQGGTEILVLFAGQKTEIKAKIVGTDPKTDLAVIKLETTKDLPLPAQWSDMKTVEVGDWAIAIGSPFALGQSVTVGIVSAKGGRNSAALTGAEYGGDLIQTDAAINPGNSGGPLCDIDGKVMGVNTAIYTRSGGYMGIGFAIPADLAQEVVTKLVTTGKVVRGWLGVLIQPLKPELAKDLGLKDGVAIHEVVEDSPAANAGLKAGDVIIEVDGKAVTEVTQLQRVISSFKPGQTVRVKAIGYADKKAKHVTVKIGELPDEATLAGKEPTESTQEPDKLGLILGPTKNKKGIKIEGFQPGAMGGSIGEQLGLEPGDVILSVNRKPVGSIAEYKKIIKDLTTINLEVERKGRKLFFSFSMNE